MEIVNTEVPVTSRSCEAMLDALVARYPFCSTEIVTWTAFSRPVRALTIGGGPRRVLYTAAHHANEWITALVLLKFIEEYAAAIEKNSNIFGIPAQRIQKNTTIYLVPMVDPDGVDLVTGAIPPGSDEYLAAAEIAAAFPAIAFPEGWKANLLGVDLNLQYPAGWLQAREIKFSQGYTRPAPRDYVGRAPLNQRESRGLADYTQRIDPVLVLAFHSQGEEIYWQFEDIEIPGARLLGEEFARLSGYALTETPENSAYAGYKDWFIRYFRRPGYTIEVGRGENPLPLSQFPQIYRENLGILTTAATGLPAQ